MSRKCLLDCSANGAKWADDVQSIPACPFETVGSGHFPQLEVPGQVNAMIETFCDQL
jgi:hypothetical protein